MAGTTDDVPTVSAESVGMSLPKVVHIKTLGEKIDTQFLAVPGKITVMAFTSPASPSNTIMQPVLEHIGRAGANVAVRILDIDRPGHPGPDLDSPISLMYRLKDQQLPAVKVYDQRGDLLMHGEEALNWVQNTIRQLPPPEFGKGPYPVDTMQGEVSEITHGNEVDIRSYLSEEANTIVMFHSPFCPPCRRMRPILEKLAEEHDDFVLRKVDVNRPGVLGIDYQSPVSRQYRVPHLPFVKVANKEGEIISEGQSAMQGLFAALEKLEADAAAARPKPRGAFAPAEDAQAPEASP